MLCFGVLLFILGNSMVAFKKYGMGIDTAFGCKYMVYYFDERIFSRTSGFDYGSRAN